MSVILCLTDISKLHHVVYVQQFPINLVIFCSAMIISALLSFSGGRNNLVKTAGGHEPYCPGKQE